MSGEPPPIPRVAPLAPLNALPLDYVPPTQNRPGVITAMGVISIIVAAISGIASVIAVLMSFGFWVASQMPVPRATATVAPGKVAVKTPGAGVTVQSNLEVGPHGLESPQRRIVINGLREKQSMSPKRAKMLDALLAETGQDMFVFGGGSGMSASAVAASVSDFGQVHKLDGSPGQDYFILGNGRVELFDDHAVYLPSDGHEPVRVSEEEIAAQSNALGEDEVQIIVDQIQSRSGNKLTPAHTASLKTLLSGESQPLIDKSSKSPIVNQITMVQVQPDGTVVVRGWAGGFVMLDGKGAVISSFSPSTGFTGVAVPTFKISGAAALTVAIEAILNLALAVFLLVAGILTLRQSLRGRALHLIYAVIKLPFVIVAIIGTYLLAASFYNSLTTGGAPIAVKSSAMGIMFAVMVSMGMLYPIALLIALNTRGVRAYYYSQRS